MFNGLGGDLPGVFSTGAGDVVYSTGAGDATGAGDVVYLFTNADLNAT